jgi:hypothetical protein
MVDDGAIVETQLPISRLCDLEREFRPHSSFASSDFQTDRFDQVIQRPHDGSIFAIE